MDAPTILVFADSSEGNFINDIDIGLDVVHPVPVAADAFPAVTIVAILANHGEAIRGIHEYLQGVPIKEEMSTLRFRMGMVEAENASLRGKIRTMEAIKTVTHSQERRTRREMERQLALVHESQRQDRENFRRLQELFEKMMHWKFQMSSMGELTFFLGLQVKQKEDGIFISQDKYVTEILKKFGFTDVKTASTPIETQKPLLKDEDGEEVDVHIYRSMIGSLMYLTSSRPDIMFAMCACARYQVNPKVSHLHAVKRIFRYLKGQLKLGLWYPKDSPFDLVAYTDSDYARASLDRKSTIGDC
ncbi:uncharacterized mitochondrial protein-like protein [Tanacetum coccineum]|uniref:Uncharacterized mitochondrial protein-like protein n=1 Tax=Tanacetum coccineum TaxID=301880 RepID=A0ABQ5J565_9ASTR